MSREDFYRRVCGIPWWSSGWDSVLSLPRARVQSLVRELRSHKAHRVAKKKKKLPGYEMKKVKKEAKGILNI